MFRTEKTGRILSKKELEKLLRKNINCDIDEDRAGVLHHGTYLTQYYDGVKYYYNLDGYYHRKDGPAICYFSKQEYYINGDKLSRRKYIHVCRPERTYKKV